ncbi:DUF2631 domain-containing protein [Corynebacterium tapiri]|uniref:DUF2631 domain-containing protein n=1 Tax=Corynebacterium tapiri TaxID=1448266 RepID=A0A5C4U6K2_9CORY|nr:DUF2631 domain-containing protein [Corynebacterium tapiri]TNL99285.1 DUF2631 domain-containing protein [Corynebacterium tapiri]
MAASHSEKAYEVHNGVSTRDVPSAAFGYSAVSRTTVQLAGWFSVFVLLMFNFGNHSGHVETIWLFSLAAVIALGLILHAFEPKLSQVRTLTGHNKPQGHQEPDWAYLQKTLSGPYAELSDSNLRALNIEPSRVAHLRSGATTGSTAVTKG